LTYSANLHRVGFADLIKTNL